MQQEISDRTSAIKIIQLFVSLYFHKRLHSSSLAKQRTEANRRRRELGFHVSLALNLTMVPSADIGRTVGELARQQLVQRPTASGTERNGERASRMRASGHGAKERSLLFFRTLVVFASLLALRPGLNRLILRPFESDSHCRRACA